MITGVVPPSVRVRPRATTFALKTLVTAIVLVLVVVVVVVVYARPSENIAAREPWVGISHWDNHPVHRASQMWAGSYSYIFSLLLVQLRILGRMTCPRRGNKRQRRSRVTRGRAGLP